MLLWPAMWSDPVGTLTKMFGAAGKYAESGHGSPIFFNGEIITDGSLGPAYFQFYPLTYLWRTTPVVILGLLAALVSAVSKRGPLGAAYTRQAVGGLLIFVAIFVLVLTLGNKKFDRYLLPVYAPLDLSAALGWVALYSWVKKKQHVLAPVVAGIAIMGQALVALPHFPYYFTYYNPLLGGPRAAYDVMMIGRGEGLEKAAYYLNQKPHVESLKVFSWYNLGCFSYFFNGTSEHLPTDYRWSAGQVQAFFDADYAVVYLHQWQRNHPWQLMDYLAHETPEHTIQLHGLDYVQIYKLGEPAPLTADPEFIPATAMLGKKILLEGYTVSAATFAPGETVSVALSWHVLEAPQERLKVFLHLLDESGTLGAQHDAEPVSWFRPTDSWQAGEQIVDRYQLALPADLLPGKYTLQLGMYRDSGERLAVSQEGQSLGTSVTLSA